jgi:FkbM family methyltransferase
MNIISRTGEKLKITLFDRNGKAWEPESTEEYDFLVDRWRSIRHGLKNIIAKSLGRMDVVSLFMLSKILAKKAAGAETTAERSQLSERLSGISHPEIKKLSERISETSHFEILFRGKRIRFSENSGSIFHIILQVFIENQYDVSEKNMVGKTVVDVGSQTGDFAMMCAAMGARKVYAFEPVARNYEILSNNIRENGLGRVIVPVNRGLGEKEGFVDMSGETMVKGSGIEITTLDSFLKGERVDFIKMDVEGYEENVLLGAKETISKFKPVLSFSAYHKPTDKTRLPEVVRSIRPDYRIRLNSFYEEDFYCE